MRKKLYIDIDGVFLTAKNPKKADNIEKFLSFITSNFDCYWLTTHCKGEVYPVVSYLSKYFDSETMNLLKKIKPTYWNTLKTEAIDFSADFYWLDDNPMQAEINILEKNKCKDKLIIVKLCKSNELNRVINYLKNRISENF